MQKAHNLILIMLSFVLMSFSSDRPAYKLYDSKGKEVNFNQLVRELENADVVLFGELHNNPISHWLKLEVTSELSKRLKNRIILGAEMLEADNQEQLNQYLKGEINYQQLSETARLWPNFRTDYKPLVDFAKKNNLSFIATNIPRRYASMVARHGFESLDTLSSEEKTWIAPLPITVDAELPGYKAMLDMDMGHHFQPENFVGAQAIKDATMAHFIGKNLRGGRLFLHYNGAYHSNNYEGIYWYLKKQKPEVKIVTISTIEVDDPSLPLTKEQRKLANFILVTPASMTKTH